MSVFGLAFQVKCFFQDGVVIVGFDPPAIFFKTTLNYENSLGEMLSFFFTDEFIVADVFDTREAIEFGPCSKVTVGVIAKTKTSNAAVEIKAHVKMYGILNLLSDFF